METYWAPHRAHELRLVYSLTKTFTGTWPSVPLFGAGIEPALTRTRPPTR